MATKAKKSTAGKKLVAKKAAVKGNARKEAHVDLKDLDRKSLSAKARQIKTELLAIRFNIQSPSLTDYRKKRQELAKVLSHLA